MDYCAFYNNYSYFTYTILLTDYANAIQLVVLSIVYLIWENDTSVKPFRENSTA